MLAICVLSGGLTVAAGAQTAAHPASKASTRPAAQSMSGMKGMQMTMDAPAIEQGGVPSYHARLPKGPLPKTLNPGQFSDPRVRAVYAMAAHIRGVLYQQPCYCHCDQELGHHSLLDCYVGDHASICEICLMEGMYAYEQTKKGKTPAQIRAAIERGEWKNENLNALMTPQRY